MWPVKKQLPCHATVYHRAATYFFPGLLLTVGSPVRKRDNRQQTNNISLIYDLLAVFLRNRTKGPEIQEEDKDARFKKISNLSAPDKRH